MNPLATARLRLVPLTVDQLTALVEGEGRVVGATIDPRLVEPPVTKAIRAKLEKMSNSPAEEHPWLTYWLAVSQADGRGVGLLGFKGAPDAKGEVEIGYGIEPVHRRRGLATEAVSRLLAWTFSDPRCRGVTAIAVRNDNAASQRVLTKLGARCVRRGDLESDWRIDAVAFFGRAERRASD